MFERNILLHYLNLEYRRIVGVEKFLSNERTKNTIHRVNYAAILLCKEYCLLPYSALIEDEIISELFLKKNYDAFFEVGLVRASLRESSPEEFLEKKIQEYDSSPELYGYYKKNALQELKKHDIPIIKRDFKVGKAIQQKWTNDLEEYASKSVWRDVLQDKGDVKLQKKLQQIPNIILDQGKGIIYPLVYKLLASTDELKNNKVREVLHNIYFSNFVDESTTVIITDTTFTPKNFSLDFYKGQNFSYAIFYRTFNQIGIFKEISDLNSRELVQLKVSDEFQIFSNFYHDIFGKCQTQQQAFDAINETNLKVNFHSIVQGCKGLFGLNKILAVLNNFNNKFEVKKDELITTKESTTIRDAVANKKFHLAILTALHEHEFEKVELHIGNGWNPDEIPDSSKVYLTTTIDKQGQNINAIGSYQIDTGMVEAGIFATEMITKFNPNYLIMPGVLAGKPEKNPLEKSEISFGDIIVGTKLFTFEKGKHSNDGFQKDLEEEKIDPKLIQLIRLHKEALLKKVKDDLKEIEKSSPDRLNKLDIENLAVHIAPIACSLSVVNKKGVFETQVTPIDRKTTGLEMESYAVAKACRISNNGKTKALIIKSVMDKTEHKDDKNKEVAALTSALFVKHLINDVLKFT